MDGVNNVGGGAGLDLFFKLPAPGEEGLAFSNLAKDINGVTLGESAAAKTLAIHLGFSDKDTIGSALDEVNAIASQLNMTFVNQADFEQSMLTYLNNVDPTNPTIAPVRAMLVASDKALKSGNIGGVDLSKQTRVLTRNENNAEDVAGYNATKVFSGDIYVNVRNALEDNFINLDQGNIDVGKGIDASRDINSNQVPDMKFSTTVGGNPWLAGNVYVAFLVAFMDLQRLMMQNKVVQGTIELASMNMITELAKSAADAIMAIAKTNQMIHIATAVMSAVTICISVACMVGGGKAAMKAPKPQTKMQMVSGEGGGTRMEKVPVLGADGKQVMKPGRAMGLTEGQWNTMGMSVPQFEKMSTAAVQAATDIGIAQLEGLKEMINSYKTIAERQMNKSSEIFKDNTDAITKLLADLDKIRSDLSQAVAAALRK